MILAYNARSSNNFWRDHINIIPIVYFWLNSTVNQMIS